MRQKIIQPPTEKKNLGFMTFEALCHIEELEEQNKKLKRSKRRLQSVIVQMVIMILSVSIVIFWEMLNK